MTPDEWKQFKRISDPIWRELYFWLVAEENTARIERDRQFASANNSLGFKADGVADGLRKARKRVAELGGISENPAQD